MPPVWSLFMKNASNLKLPLNCQKIEFVQVSCQAHTLPLLNHPERHEIHESFWIFWIIWYTRKKRMTSQRWHLLWWLSPETLLARGCPKSWTHDKKFAWPNSIYILSTGNVRAEVMHDALAAWRDWLTPRISSTHTGLSCIPASFCGKCRIWYLVFIRTWSVAQSSAEHDCWRFMQSNGQQEFALILLRLFVHFLDHHQSVLLWCINKTCIQGISTLHKSY
jgi:hypothetical protein